jgi:lipocalin
MLVSTSTFNKRLEKMKPESGLVDVGHFTGLWYDIESFPSKLDEDCTDMHATYLLPPGKQILTIENGCLYKGAVSKRNGHAEYVGDGRFIVNFDLFHGLSTLFSSVNLCVLSFVGSTDSPAKALLQPYQYAMVGTPYYDGLWLMSRTPQPLPAAIRAQFVERATLAGFDASLLRAVVHTTVVDAQKKTAGA